MWFWDQPLKEVWLQDLRSSEVALARMCPWVGIQFLNLLKLWSLVGSGEGCQMRPLRYCASLLACGGSSETLCLARTLRDSVGRAKTTLRPVGIKMRDAGFARLACSGGML